MQPTTSPVFNLRATWRRADWLLELANDSSVHRPVPTLKGAARAILGDICERYGLDVAQTQIEISPEIEVHVGDVGLDKILREAQVVVAATDLTGCKLTRDLADALAMLDEVTFAVEKLADFGVSDQDIASALRLPCAVVTPIRKVWTNSATD